MSTAKPVRNIVILGGGTAGWMSAAYLQRALSAAAGHQCSITVIASDEIGTVGVGEATLPTMRRMLEFLGIEEADWMAPCSATYKLGVRFYNWTKSGKQYWHPFGPMVHPEVTHAANYWLRAGMESEVEDFVPTFFPAFHLANSTTWPLDRMSKLDSAYSYHLDAGLFGDYLKRVAIERGVTYACDEIVKVDVDETGFIRSLQTKSGKTIEGDLFIDCSGFRGFLMQGIYKEPFESYGEQLLCDRAVAMPSRLSNGPRQLYTSSTALDAGWAWCTPLTTRNGNGYVYSSNHLSPEDAERRLRALLGPAAEGSEARHIKMRIGKSRRSWVKNCVGIGLAGGFIEPLESTGIFLIEAGLRSLLTFFPDTSCPEILSRRYNEQMTRYYEEIRDFIALHYFASQRTDTPFWRDASDPSRMSERLRQGVEEWQACACAPDIAAQGQLFPEFSWLCILLGAGITPSQPIPLFANLDVAPVKGLLDKYRTLSHGVTMFQ